MTTQTGQIECIYQMESAAQARIAGRRLEESFLPEVLTRLAVYVDAGGEVVLAAAFIPHSGRHVLGWARALLAEHGVRLDPEATLLTLEASDRFAAVYPDRGRGFL